MRFITTLTVALLALGAGTAAAQDKGKGKKEEPDKQKLPTITDVGGKNLDQWLQAIASKDRSISSSAVKTILLFGPDQASKAVPIIITELKKHRPPAVTIDASFRSNAVVSLTMIITSMKKPDQKHIQEAVDLLQTMLRDPQIVIRYRAAQAVRHFGPTAEKALDELIKMVKDFPTWETRQAAVAALGTVAYDKKNGPALRAVHALYSALRDTSSLVRVEAIRSLEGLGVPDLPNHKLALEQNLEPVARADPDPMVRIWANLSLYGVDPNKNKARRSAISSFLPHPEHAVRAGAAEALGLIGPSDGKEPNAKEQVPVLIPLLGDKEHSVVLSVIIALGRIGPGAAAALPRLRAVEADKELPTPLRDAAKEASDWITGKNKKDDPPKKVTGK
ncbi:MAG: HEAT repeat domain-containing protein [Gemmataceae bacterium]|nr:HEAT repeat domain-containing protein [Gemmataceae bacterium]